jgi:hypothetical protein
MIDIMRSLHGAYAPPHELFGARLETFFIGVCVALGELEERPFTIRKIAAYMRAPHDSAAQAGPAAKLGSYSSAGSQLLHGQEGAQLSPRHAKLSANSPDARKGESRIEGFGSFAGVMRRASAMFVAIFYRSNARRREF